MVPGGTGRDDSRGSAGGATLDGAAATLDGPVEPLDGRAGVADGVRSTGQPVTVVDQRPWGWFELLSHNVPATVKIITVAPGARLSLQRHRRRDEFWTVLDGDLLVEVGGRTRLTSPGEKVWIPRGTVHRVTNTGAVVGRFLELAYGHFDEDDIERLADDYDRD